MQGPSTDAGASATPAAPVEQPAGDASPAPAATEPSATSTPAPAVTATPDPGAGMTDAERATAADAALAEGRELYRKGFTESAIVQYRRAIDLNPTLVPALAEFGKILLDTRNQAFAITVYEKLARLEPNNMQWKETLFDLHSAYEQPIEAAQVGEELLRARPDDLTLLKREADLYRDTENPGRQAELLERAGTVSKQAQLYFEAGNAYTAAGRNEDATRSYREAVAIEPTNVEYQNGVGRSLSAAGKNQQARDYYADLIQKYPDAVGLKDRQAEVEMALGDERLRTRRFVAARKSFERAKELVGNANTGLGSSIDERIAKAERLNHVYIDTPFQLGDQGGNNFFEIQTVVGVPLHDEDLAVQVWNDYRTASAPGRGSGNFDNVYAGIDWKPNDTTQVFAVGGTRGIFKVGAQYTGEQLTAGVAVRRDYVSYTPDAIRTRLDYGGVTGNVGYQINDWFSLGGTMSYYAYGDNIDEFTYNVGPRVTPINRPNDFIWGFDYNHGGIFNDTLANPLLRFGPTNFQVDSVGTDIEQWIGDSFRYRLGYYHSFSNVGQDGDTFFVGGDYQIIEGSYIYFNFERGNFVGGRVSPGLFYNNADNYVLSGGVHVTF